MEPPDLLARAQAVQAAAAQRGFDWPDAAGVLAKVREETGEIADALAAGDQEHARRELGDLLLVSIHLATHLGIPVDKSLAGALERFESRWAQVQILAAARGLPIAGCAPVQLEALWQEAKTLTVQPPESGG